ncbi:MAG: hypothetical protein KUA43_09385 [Hoeflea sp.]|uniref:hypothetical protein n=1 Tax=Hoeflea sp. TaxID=1940281 RepID=UPI001DD5502F|nr:hypothetical protein [Hoeflea sp.]MBU4528387.1 hypothetical protein [Alphaproteobacteria bacterium]MBU4543056.1 hypothetical protein [Alphaproteobacteria bacterium]MBU4551747.1 hypothetical protein [Alphaproteobacteria bacterium]MBV1723642.1 hypothetical protein [Hoeflea sp.]MBV1761958.1 hypothetical protein [Hoeflea sp.]
MVDKRKWQAGDRMIASAMVWAMLTILPAGQALALSELQEVEPPSAETGQEAPPPIDEPQSSPDVGLPSPEPVIRAVPQTQDEDMDAAPAISRELPPVDILTDPALLPEPVQRMRQLIIEAASTGIIDNLRALLGSGPTATQLAFGQIDTDPVEYLRSVSGDGEGQEILAILIDLLSAGFVRIDADEPDEIFVWPYFAAVPLDALTPPQKVELLRLVTAGDVEDMKAYGAYNFYRIGISPEGEWIFFLAGH